MMADVITLRHGGIPFTWGGANLVEPGRAQERYIAALRHADQNDLALLLEFARS
jgi:hypothetical protein